MREAGELRTRGLLWREIAEILDTPHGTIERRIPEIEKLMAAEKKPEVAA